MKRLLILVSVIFAAMIQQTFAEGTAEQVAHIDKCEVSYKETSAPSFVQDKGGTWWDVEVTSVVTNTSDRNIFFKVKSYLCPSGRINNDFAANAKPLKVAAGETRFVTQVLKANSSRFNPVDSSYVVKTILFDFDKKWNVDTVYTDLMK